MNPIKDIVIVGGGTAGLITALFLKSFYSNNNILVIQSSNIGIVGVGEGSTEQWELFQRLCNIDFKEVINETDATIKIGILFKDWNYKGNQYVHSVEYSKYINDLSVYGTFEYYNQLLLQNHHLPFPLNPSFSSTYSKNNVDLSADLEVSNQYHFDTFKLNSFLTKKCKERGVKFQDCVIKDLKQDSKGEIISLITNKNKEIKGNFFIDCSGFKRVLMSKLGVKWKSFTEYLPMNQAITLATDLNPQQGIEPYTTTTALSSGWAWKIPTQKRYGNGYVFSNNHTSPDEALNEFNQHLGINVEKLSKNIKFEAGRLEKFWYKNCVSIGLSSSFVEPLEAQSIGFSIHQSLTLIRYLSIWLFDKNISEKYNKESNETFDNIVDFVQLHYVTKRNDSKFWKEKPFTLTDFNKNTLKRFSYGIYLPQEVEVPHYLFKLKNFYQLYCGLNLLNKDTIKLHQKLYPQQHHLEWKEKVENEKINNSTISHIDYLKLVKENFSS